MRPRLTGLTALLFSFSSACVVGQYDIPKDSVIPCEVQEDCPPGWNCGSRHFCETGCEIRMLAVQELRRIPPAA